ncbi:hypothetical protein HHK36_030886 [Tetracentron sinense]|uniref:Uncharacterized protein n=1 Tax=Tetracentron sinense TaxID=13715 RepID=A0A834YAL5_TETSI|nr:hypothetical protein HHK36_030886 [Tetracentron sinense]
MSMPLESQQQQSPQEAPTSHSGHGSFGPVIAVLVVITILGIVAGMIGRLCSGRRIIGLGQYDFKDWVEKKFSACIDGRIDSPASPPPNISDACQTAPIAIPIESPKETKQSDVLFLPLKLFFCNFSAGFGNRDVHRKEKLV